MWVWDVWEFLLFFDECCLLLMDRVLKFWVEGLRNLFNKYFVEGGFWILCCVVFIIDSVFCDIVFLCLLYLWMGIEDVLIYFFVCFVVVLFERGDFILFLYCRVLICCLWDESFISFNEDVEWYFWWVDWFKGEGY